MQAIHILLRYFKFYFRAKTRYQVHSPFIYDFVVEILDDRRQYYAFPIIEKLRKYLLKDRTKIPVTDYGAGSQVDNHKKRSVRNIARYSATTPYFCQVLFRMIHHYQPKNILELGTSLGISTLYQAAPTVRGSRFITIEGCPHVSKLALENFERVGVQNIELWTGRFEEKLPSALDKLGRLDYVFIDGNHKKKPTIDYFEQCLKYAHEDSIFIFDDIHWSEEMEAAWANIIQHPKVKVSIDLFFCGVIFFRSEQKEVEHFDLIAARWKPLNL